MQPRYLTEIPLRCDVSLRETKKEKQTIPSSHVHGRSNLPYRGLVDWSVVDVAARNGQHPFHRGVKEWSNPWLLLRTSWCYTLSLYNKSLGSFCNCVVKNNSQYIFVFSLLKIAQEGNNNRHEHRGPQLPCVYIYIYRSLCSIFLILFYNNY